jgi:hypothetical protein
MGAKAYRRGVQSRRGSAVGKSQETEEEWREAENLTRRTSDRSVRERGGPERSVLSCSLFFLFVCGGGGPHLRVGLRLFGMAPLFFLLNQATHITSWLGLASLLASSKHWPLDLFQSRGITSI